MMQDGGNGVSLNLGELLITIICHDFLQFIIDREISKGSDLSVDGEDLGFLLSCLCNFLLLFYYLKSLVDIILY